MALITCSNCGKEISDKAKACPQCGQPVVLTPVEVEAAEPMICQECGAEVPAGSESCPNCGCPVPEKEEPEAQVPQKVEVTSVNLPKMKANTKKYVVIAVVVAAALLIAVLIGNKVSQKKQLKAYEAQLEAYGANLKTASSTMLRGAIKAEDAGNLIKSVWYNAIYKERDTKTDKYTRPNGYFLDDFNDALGNLFSDSDFQTTISSIQSNQDSVSRLMKELKNPPEEYEEAYEALKKYYDAYTALTNLVTNPSGSLQTFSQNFNSADSDVANRYDAMKMYLD
ncbi:MAG: zinc-ribbon domain-containing protein [Faecousia sp.]